MSKAGNFFAKLAADKEAMDKLDHVLGGKEIRVFPRLYESLSILLV